MRWLILGNGSLVEVELAFSCVEKGGSLNVYADGDSQEVQRRLYYSYLGTMNSNNQLFYDLLTIPQRLIMLRPFPICPSRSKSKSLSPNYVSPFRYREYLAWACD